MRVLVIDDNKAMRMIIKRELRPSADVVGDERALVTRDLLGSEPVDFVLSDWNTPGERPTVASALEGLLRRPVTATTSDPPCREVARALEGGA